MLLILIYFSDILFLLFFRKVASDLYYVDYFEPFCLISTFVSFLFHISLSKPIICLTNFLIVDFKFNPDNL